MIEMSQHWPLVTLVLIAFLTTCSFYCSLHAFPPTASLSNRGFVMFLMSSVAMTLYFFFASMIANPGYVPLRWRPASDADRRHLEFCQPCAGFKPPRSHHCRRCNRCVKRMDHHCPFLNNCVGHGNHSLFLMCIASALTSVSAGIVPVSVVLWRYHDPGGPALAVTSGGQKVLVCAELFLLLVGSGVASLVFAQLQGTWSNQTYVEKLLADVAEDAGRPFRNPYDVGALGNFAHLMGCLGPLLDDRGEEGVEFPLREGGERHAYQKLRRLLMRPKQGGTPADRTTTRPAAAPKRLYHSFRIFSDYVMADPDKGGGCRRQEREEDERPPLSPPLEVRAGERVTVFRKKGNWLYGRRHNCMEQGWFPATTLRK